MGGGGSCFSVYQISWMKTKKGPFWKLKRHLVGTLFTIYKHLGDFVKCIFAILLQIQHENNIQPTGKHQQAKVHHFLGVCLYECFIYRSNFAFRKCLETRRHLGSGRKTVNGQGYIPSYGSQSKRTKIAIRWFGKFLFFLYFFLTTTTVYSLTKDKSFTVLYAPQRATYQANLDGKNNFPV